MNESNNNMRNMRSVKFKKRAATTFRTVPSVESVPAATFQISKIKIKEFTSEDKITMRSEKWQKVPAIHTTVPSVDDGTADMNMLNSKTSKMKESKSEDIITKRSEKWKKVPAVHTTVPSVDDGTADTIMLISKILKLKKSKTKRGMKQAGGKKESHGGTRNGAANEAVHIGRAEVRDRLYRSLQCNKEGRLLAALIEKRCQVSWDMWDFRNSIDKKKAQKA
jgi:hypothetical protein